MWQKEVEICVHNIENTIRDINFPVVITQCDGQQINREIEPVFVASFIDTFIPLAKVVPGSVLTSKAKSRWLNSIY